MASSPAANKRQGSRFEIDLVKYLREQGYDAERLHLNGMEDEGDIVVRLPREGGTHYIVIEAKSGAFQPAYQAEALVEAKHFADHRGLPQDSVTPLLVLRSRGKPMSQAFAIRPLEDWLGAL